MTYHVLRIEADEWLQKYSENAHSAVFQKLLPGSLVRISYALLVANGKNEVVGYVTVREQDAETVYWQFGGVMPVHQKSLSAYRCFQALLVYAKENSKRVSFYVENKNRKMLRLALDNGFLIIGTRTFRNDLYVDMLKEFDSGD